MKRIGIYLFLIITIILFSVCVQAEIWYRYLENNYSIEKSVYKTIPTPAGYERIRVYKNSFAEWVRYLPVKSENADILTYTGNELSGDYVKNFFKIWRIIDFPLYFKQNLEHCADWGYRFWYEYQKEVGFGDDLWLTDYNGKKITYNQWKNGKTNPSLKEFFKWTCNYANSYSQKAGLYEVKKEDDLRPGDIIVQNETGGIGHTSIIFDICKNKEGKWLYLVGYSFMPAQECHIEKASDEYGFGGWFTLEGYCKYLEEYLPFGKPEIRSFIQQESLTLTDNPIHNWQKYERAIRDSKISPEQAIIIFPKIVEGLNKFALKYKFNKLDKWIFPVEGYSVSSIGEYGQGFKSDIRYGVSPIKGYSFYDGNRHGGHPAHDIFIHDNNQDYLDDHTGKPVFVRAMLDGIVISTLKDWQTGSKLRGGNYIWIYHPQENIISYYAHLNQIMVNPGQIVSAGERLGTIGRTGFSADLKRSPTHLHLMTLEYKNNELVPYDFYSKIK